MLARRVVLLVSESLSLLQICSADSQGLLCRALLCIWSSQSISWFRTSHARAQARTVTLLKWLQPEHERISGTPVQPSTMHKSRRTAQAKLLLM